MPKLAVCHCMTFIILKPISQYNLYKIVWSNKPFDAYFTRLYSLLTRKAIFYTIISFHFGFNLFN